MQIVYLGLGSNLGNREEELQNAVRKLQRADFRIRRASPVYETEPVDYLPQPSFLNAVIEAESDVMPMRLLTRIAIIEREMGRKRTIEKGPRSIDIDILLYGPFVVQTPKLQIPHPRMTERRFVLQPLLELAPALRHPVSRRPLQEDLLRLTGQRTLRKSFVIDILARDE